MTNGKSKWTAVFVHGIFSSGDTFKAMADAFDKSPAFARCAPYNYNYNKSMTENAKRLAAEIKDVAAPVVLAPDNGADRSRFPAAGILELTRVTRLFEEPFHRRRGWPRASVRDARTGVQPSRPGRFWRTHGTAAIKLMAAAQAFDLWAQVKPSPASEAA